MTMLNHRLAPGGLVNGQRMPSQPDPVPCEACGDPVYLIDAEHLCRPGRRIRHVAVLDQALWQYVAHRCGEPPAGIVCGPCPECRRRERAMIDGLLDEAEELREEAERHAAEAERLLAEIDENRRVRLARLGGQP